MNKVRFDSYFEFVEDILAYYEDTHSEIAIYAKASDAPEIVREFIGQDYMEGETLKLEYIDLDEMEQEVVLISLDENDGLWVENAVGNGGKFLMSDGEVVYAPIEYLNEVKEASCADDITVYSIGESEEEEEEPTPQDKKVTVLTDEDGKIGGFKFEDKQDGKCFSVEYCNCKPVEDIDGMLEMYEKIMEAYLKFH